jgi:Leucine-rich repeat (LRR) protein
MKTILYIIFIITILTGCSKKTSTEKQPTETNTNTVLTKETENNIEPTETSTQAIFNNNLEKEREYVIIGGKQYKRGWEIESVYLMVDPEDTECSNSLENIELHWNLKELTIEGKNLDKIDFSPVSLLTKIEKLEIKGNITQMPDMKNLKQLREVEVIGAALKSLEGINGIGIERIIIDSFITNDNTLLKVSDMKNLVNLKHFVFDRGKIDVGGIDRFTSLEILILKDCEPYNINSIGNIKNLKSLSINLISENPSVEFLKNMPNLERAYFFGNFHLYDYIWSYNFKPSYVLDVAPLATSKKLKDIVLINFIIKNISALDSLDIPNYIFLVGSKLYDETEKSRHYLKLEREGR